jgi:hypothetical protein
MQSSDFMNAINQFIETIKILKKQINIDNRQIREQFIRISKCYSKLRNQRQAKSFLDKKQCLKSSIDDYLLI